MFAPPSSKTAHLPLRHLCSRNQFRVETLFEAGTSFASSLKVARWRLDTFEATPTFATTDYRFIEYHRAGSVDRVDGPDGVIPPRSLSIEPTHHTAVRKGPVQTARSQTDISAAVSLREIERFKDQELASLLDCCETSLRQPGSPAALELGARFQVIRMHLVRRSKGGCGTAALEKPRRKSKQSRRALEMIDADLGASLSLQLLPSASGISPHNFSRHFKATMATTVCQYVLEHRILRAQHMLCETEDSIDAIAFEAGLSSQAHLTAAFRQRMGTTPKLFRSENARIIVDLAT